MRMINEEEDYLYYYDENDDMFVFEDDLMEYLLQHGICSEHIHKMQTKILESRRDAYQNYPPSNSAERNYVDLVPLDKVIGTSRGTEGQSVYENVRVMYRGDREPNRFERCLSFLDTMSLEELRKSYEELYDPVEMEYYVDDDAYYLTSNGNHRTLVAMLVGAKYIRAKVTNGYCDTSKKEKFLCSKEFKEKYKIENIMRDYLNSSFDISFKDDKGVYEICGYPGPEDDEDLFSFIDRLSQMIDAETKKAYFIRKLPNNLQKMVLKSKRNYRIEQYVNRKYLTKEERYIWRNRLPASLYEL